jgi:hypothetical protein
MSSEDFIPTLAANMTAERSATPIPSFVTKSRQGLWNSQRLAFTTLKNCHGKRPAA